MLPEAVPSGRWNRRVGWTLMLLGLALTAALAPALFGQSTVVQYVGNLSPALQHALGVVLGMALLQLALGAVLDTNAFQHAERDIAAWLTAVGVVVYTLGYALGLRWPMAHALVPIGSLLNLSGFLYLLYLRPAGPYAQQIRLILPVACLGMLLDFAAGLLQAFPEIAPAYIGSDGGVRLRMLRLARVAAIALSALTLLYYGVARGRESHVPLVRWGGLSLIAGAIGMPAILAAACFMTLHLKYLLVLPATAVLVGVCVATYFALREASLLERWGWLLIAGSISVGMLMGLYAFEGPLPTPEFLGDYHQWERRLSRMAHSYCILLGMVAIFLARDVRSFTASLAAKIGTLLFFAGSAITVAAMSLPILVPVPAEVLRSGLALVVVACVVCLASSRRSTALAR